MQKEYHISTLTAIKSGFTGSATGTFTPNRIGGFIGRVMYLPPDKVLSGTLNSFIGNLAQLMATLIFGIIGAMAILLVPIPIDEITAGTDQWRITVEPILPITVFGFGLILLFLVYFFPEKWVTLACKVKMIRKHEDKLNFLKVHSKAMLAEVLVWSLVRYLVFATQFYLTMLFFGATFSFLIALMLVGYLYLIITLIPTFLGKLGVRETFAMLIFAHFVPEELGNSASTFGSLALWVLNVGFAAILGGILVLFIKRRK